MTLWATSARPSTSTSRRCRFSARWATGAVRRPRSPTLAAVYSALGDKRKALDFYEQALPLMRQVGDRAGEARTLNNIGVVYTALGDKHKALDFYEQALLLHRQVGDRGDEATTLNNIGAVYSDLGDKHKALDFYEQALLLQRQVGARWRVNTRLQLGHGL